MPKYTVFYYRKSSGVKSTRSAEYYPTEQNDRKARLNLLIELLRANKRVEAILRN